MQHMPRISRTHHLLALIGAASLTLAGCANERLQHDGLKAVDAGKYEEGVDKLDQAARQEPGNLSYKLDLKARREAAVQALIAAADRARAAGQLEEAQQGYQRVLTIEASNNRALAGLEQLKADRRHAAVIAQAGKDIEQGRLNEAEAALRMVLAENPGSAAASALRAKIDTARGPGNATPQLRTRDNRPVTLQFREAPTKMVFEVLARQTGINFIFDKDVKGDTKTTIFVDKVTLAQAIDLILSQNQLGQQVLASNMVLIYPDTLAKQKDYQDHIVRTFYITNTDPKKVAELLKTVIGAKTIFTDDRTNTVIMRDRPQLVRMAERLIASIDVPEAEVMMEVEVLEITRSKLQELGVNYPTGLTITPTPLAGTPMVLADLKDQDETTLKVSEVALGINLSKSVGSSNVLANPRIRARNREKAKVLIGNRVPVITNSLTATATGNISNGSVQYLDVGLTLEVEPTVHISGDVAIKVNLEVSSIVKEVSVPTGNGGATLAYQIGTRHASTALELKDGETQILAGLINESDRRSSSRVPGLGDIPIIGRLFGSHSGDRERSEIVLSITPHIIRAQPRAAGENIEFWYGTENQQRSAPLGSGAGATDAAGKPPPVLVDPPQGNANSGADGGNAADAAADAAEKDKEKEKDKDKPAPNARPTLQLDGEPSASVGEEFNVTLSIDNAADLANIRAMLRFDPLVLQFVGGGAGNLVAAQQPGAVPRADVGGGRVRFEVSGGQVNGNGQLAIMRFKALAPRPQTMVTLQQFAASDATGAAQSIMAPRPLVIAITP
jgi:general secretion pathway protein D